jgi:hypothetical protein
MNNEIMIGFKKMIEDLEIEFKKYSEFNDCHVGKEYAKDYGVEDGLLKFKIYYKSNVFYPSPDYCDLIRDITQMMDYPSLRSSDKSKFIEHIIREIRTKLSKQ